MIPLHIDYRTVQSGAAGFAEAWRAVGGTVEVVAPGERDRAIERWVGGDARAPWPAAPAEVAAADCAVVVATGAIAQTGTVVVDSTANRGRSNSLLPPRVAFVVDEATIVDTPGDVLRHRHRWWPERPPSQIVFISGPSRSADIEMTLTVGVHGPGAVHAIVVRRDS